MAVHECVLYEQVLRALANLDTHTHYTTLSHSTTSATSATCASPPGGMGTCRGRGTRTRGRKASGRGRSGTVDLQSALSPRSSSASVRPGEKPWEGNRLWLRCRTFRDFILKLKAFWESAHLGNRSVHMVRLPSPQSIVFVDLFCPTHFDRVYSTFHFVFLYVF